MKLWIYAAVALFLSMQCFAKESLRLTLASQIDGGHEFYHELLYEALTREGYKVRIEIPSEHIPQKRVIKMVQGDKLSMTWLLSTPERDGRYVSVDVPLTNGLIGKRVLLIPPDLQPKFDAIETIDELRDSKLVAGMGVNWFDVDVWNNNQLSVYLEDGEWRSLYDKLSVDGDVNYFPRGINEIGAEAAMNRHLAIEKRLLLVYEKDFKFYLSPSMAQYKTEIESALKQAKQDGLIDQLVEKYWGASYKTLNPTERVVIKLTLPNLESQKH
ncbi:hypothetical protein [Vibrio hepatarius]|uniref:hypothetical protein n=1 Tax=Vibrio hepatarius TaxID=171383 RepID=UPI003735500B